MTTDNKDQANSVSPFAKIVGDILAGDRQQENRELTLIALMAGMELTFSLDFCMKFLKATGKEKGTRINAVLTELYPDFKDIVRDSLLNPKDGKNAHEAAKLLEGKQEAQNKRKKLENMLRRAIFSLFYLLDTKSSDIKVSPKHAKMQYDMPKADNPKKVVEMLSTRGELEKYGRDRANSKGLVAATTTDKNTNRVTGPNKASNGVSLAGQLSKASTGLDMISELATGLALVLKADQKLTDKQEEAVRVLEQLIVTRNWANETKTAVDVKGLADFYGVLTIQDAKDDASPAKDEVKAPLVEVAKVEVAKPAKVKAKKAA